MLQARQLSVEVGGRLTLEGATFTVRAGDKVGLVGRNGAGKTSLFKVLGGEAPAYAGDVVIQGRLGFLTQDPRRLREVTDSTGLSYVLSGRGLDEAAQRMEKLRLAMEEDPSHRAISRFTKAEEAFSNAGGYQAESEVRALVAGLGLGDDRIDLPIDVLSGGERRRVELARILFAGSDVLMLDEPTNHLSAALVDELTDAIRETRAAVVVATHDRQMLRDLTDWPRLELSTEGVSR